MGNLTTSAELDGSSASYSYDGLYRVATESRTGDAAESASYNYDLAGNPTISGVTYDAANKSSANAYDGDGNPTTYALGGANVGMTWNDDDKLTGLTTTAGTAYFGYDASGLRVAEQAVDGSKRFFVYDGTTLVGEVDASGNPRAVYTPGISEHVYPAGATDYSLWYSYDAQGATRDMTDSTGAVTDTYTYSAYGVPLSATGTDPNPFVYGGEAGYYTDPAMDGLILCGQRWYSPGYGRWLSRDPAGYDGGADLYAYCGDDPIPSCGEIARTI